MDNSYFSLDTSGKLIKDVARLIQDTNNRFGTGTIYRASDLPEYNGMTVNKAA